MPWQQSPIQPCFLSTVLKRKRRTTTFHSITTRTRRRTTSTSIIRQSVIKPKRPSAMCVPVSAVAMTAAWSTMCQAKTCRIHPQAQRRRMFTARQPPRPKRRISIRIISISVNLSFQTATTTPPMAWTRKTAVSSSDAESVQLESFNLNRYF
jgi:hypothetical protein